MFFLANSKYSKNMPPVVTCYILNYCGENACFSLLTATYFFGEGISILAFSKATLMFS